MHLLPPMSICSDVNTSGLKTCGGKNIVATIVFVPGAPRAALATKKHASLSKPPSAAPNASIYDAMDADATRNAAKCLWKKASQVVDKRE
jgi:hypothetical protein